MVETTLRKATKEDLGWVNATYASIDFLPSTLQNEIVVIASVDNQKVGLGRVGVIDENSCELGGIYVNPNFRNQGIARKVVQFLLDNAQKSVIYCIPFEHLAGFYEGFGFKKIEQLRPIPVKITEKLDFCAKTYSEKTLLLVIFRN